METVAKDFAAAPYLLYVILTGCGAALWWFATAILIPVRDDHRDFLKKLDKNLERIGDQVEQMPCRITATYQAMNPPPQNPARPPSAVREVQPL